MLGILARLFMTACGSDPKRDHEAAQWQYRSQTGWSGPPHWRLPRDAPHAHDPWDRPRIIDNWRDR
jgi:hypothetical protein